MALASFHPAVRAWFESKFLAPTRAQLQAWPSIQSGRHTLLAAPTGSGKTLAAFLAALNDLVEEAQKGRLPAECRVLYVSPLKALSNDVKINLEDPVQGIRKELFRQGFADADIATWVRTGDTPASERVAAIKKPPHIIVTTPESLYLLLTSASGQGMLRTVRTVIVDEIHAVIGSKRGSHLALTLERLQRVARAPLVRVGLSATQRPMDQVAKFLLGSSRESCTLIDIGHTRTLDLGLEVPNSPLEPVMSTEVWKEIYQRLVELIHEHATTLIFTNTRRLAERVARQLSEVLGDDKVTSHHGSLSRERRLKAEQRLKNGELKALVATASLELGIDIGAVDLVCQIGSPRTLSALLQRAGRANHSVAGLPKARIFPLSRDELVECAAALDAIRRGELDRQVFPKFPLDILAQQIVAMVASETWPEDELFEFVRGAYPYRDLEKTEFHALVKMVSEGFDTKRGRRGALLHRDAVNRVLSARKGARLTALTNAGAIPDTADYQVVLEPGGSLVGSVNEDFAVESLVGDIFQLGNTSWKILRVEQGRVRVEDARGQPPSVPFWLGEAPGRSNELSLAVDRLRTSASPQSLSECGVPSAAIEQVENYFEITRASLGVMPSQKTLVVERFFDESGGMQLVLHSPYGSRINRAWGLALRKRFCRTFNFELQAAATEDAIVLSLGTTQSFPLESVFKFLHSNTVKGVLVQALLTAPMFEVRWRWNVNRALAVPRFVGGKKVPPQIQRMRATDLLSLVFPDQLACAENTGGRMDVPDHPLVNETIRDCLHDAMDIDGLIGVLTKLEAGEIRTVAKDVTEPSPMAQEILNARPYAFLDDAPLEERRTQAVYSRRWLDPQSASDLGALDPEAIARVRAEAWPEFSNADELHDALTWLSFMTEGEMPSGADLWTLIDQGRATSVVPPSGRKFWIATEKLPIFEALWPGISPHPVVAVPEEFREKKWTKEDALKECVRGRLDGSGPVTAREISELLAEPESNVESALLALEAEGAILRGHFMPKVEELQWCERRLLARIHRYTLNRLRAEIEPVAASDFLRFLFDWQHVSPSTRLEGREALSVALKQLEGFAAPAAAWESEILPARFKTYDPAWLDSLSLSGRAIWWRAPGVSAGSAPVRSTPIALGSRKSIALWAQVPQEEAPLSSDAECVRNVLKAQGALFFDELVDSARLLPAQTERALAELVAKGRVRSDSFAGLRQMVRKPSSKVTSQRRWAEAGRWTLASAAKPMDVPGDVHEEIARALLARYGVVFRKLLEREKLPPWRALAMAFRSMEARGEVRGGRFVAGFSGEQYALPEAVGLLRETRRSEPAGSNVSLSAADPLNLIGILTPGRKIPALAKNRVLYRDGHPIAVYEGRDVKPLGDLPASELSSTRAALFQSNERTPRAKKSRPDSRGLPRMWP